MFQIYRAPAETLKREIVVRVIPEHYCDPDCLCWILKRLAKKEEVSEGEDHGQDSGLA